MGRKGLLRRVLLEAALLLGGLALGLGAAGFQEAGWLPSLSGSVSAVRSDGERVYLALAGERGGSLVLSDFQGNVCGCAVLPEQQAFRVLEPSGETVFAILDAEWDGALRQTLVSLPAQGGLLRPEALLDLTALAPGVVWSGMAPLPDGVPGFRLTGIGEDGQGWRLDWETDGVPGVPERIPTAGPLYALQPVADGRLVWIGRDRKAGQLAGGRIQADLLRGLAETPLALSACGARCLVSDSVTGDLWELLPDGSARRCRAGTDEIGSTGLAFRQLECFTADGEDASGLLGLCRTARGSAVVGERFRFDSLRCGTLRFPLLLRYGWRLAAACWAGLRLLAALLHAAFASRRLAVRLCVSELLLCLVLAGTLTAVQYGTFRESLYENALQRLHLIGSSLAATLEHARPSGGAAAQALAVSSFAAAADGADYTLSVYWQTDGGVEVGYDSDIPSDYLVEDVRPREYLDAVTRCLSTGEPELSPIRYATRTEYLSVQPFTMGGVPGCVAVSQDLSGLRAEQAAFLRRMFPVLALCALLFAALLLLTLRLLRPLDRLKGALEDFYECGGGNQVVLEGMPRTELYELGWVFNQLSVQARSQMDALSRINGAYARLVPARLPELLHRRGVIELAPGDCTEAEGALLFLLPAESARGGAVLAPFAAFAAGQAAAHGGLLTSYDGRTGALVAAFSEPGQAYRCARECAFAFPENGQTAAVLCGPFTLGVFGGEQMLPLNITPGLPRQLAALERLRGFGAVLVCGQPSDGLRLLGWDGADCYYEDPAFRPPAWQGQWQEAAPYWSEAVGLYRGRAFSEAMRRFARFLRLVPGDRAARWYLLRCEALRDGGSGADTGLLYDWREDCG